MDEIQLSQEMRHALAGEGGLVEVLSAYGHLFNAALMGILGGKVFLQHKHYFITICLFFAARELDWDKTLFTVGLLKGDFLFSPEVPIAERLLGGIILFVILQALYLLVRRHWRQFLTGLLHLQPVQVFIGAAMALIVFSKAIDGIGRKLAAFDIRIGVALERNSQLLEEVLELGIPLFLLLAIVVYFRKQASR